MEIYTYGTRRCTFDVFLFTISNAEFTPHVFIISRKKSSRADEQHARLHRRVRQRHEAVYRLYRVFLFLSVHRPSSPRSAFRTFLLFPAVSCDRNESNSAGFERIGRPDEFGRAGGRGGTIYEKVHSAFSLLSVCRFRFRPFSRPSARGMVSATGPTAVGEKRRAEKKPRRTRCDRRTPRDG